MFRRKRILFFAPHAGLWVHAFPEAVIAESISKNGYLLTMVGCNGILSERCVVFDANRVLGKIPDEARSRICADCIEKRNRIWENFKFHTLLLDDFVSEEDVSHVDALISTAEPAALLDLVVDDLPVGRFASYETLLVFKTSNMNFTGQSLEHYLGCLRSALLALRGFKRIYGQIKPHIFETYNSLYSVNRTLSQYAQSNQSSIYTMHAGSNFSHRLQRMMIAKDNTLYHEKYVLSLWDKFKDKPCSSSVAAASTDHLLVMMQAWTIFQYGSSVNHERDVRDYFGVAPHQKLLLATMSSEDERFASRIVTFDNEHLHMLFPDQIEWIMWLIDYVSKRPDLFLVIRVHPREFPNRRDGQTSEHAQKLQVAFSTLPPNTVVNWPDDGVSIYDFLRQTDVVLNYHSSVGMEAPMFGIPVVAYSKAVHTFPTDFCLIGETEAQYTQAIEIALEEGWNFDRIRLVYRWLALHHTYSVLDISDAIRLEEGASEPFQAETYLTRLLGKFRDYFSPGWRANYELRRPARLANERLLKKLLEINGNSIADVCRVPNISLEDETQALIGEVRRLAVAIGLEQAPDTVLGRAINQFLLHVPQSKVSDILSMVNK